MPRALVLNTASKANTTGGTFADTLTINSGDSLAVANFNNGGAKIIEAWAMDSTSVAEIQVIYTRPESTHDQSHGFRALIAATAGGGAGKNQAQNILPGYEFIDLYKSDSPTVQVTTTAADNFAYTWLSLYDDLPGVSGVFCSWQYVSQHQKSSVGIRCDAVASGTAGAYGTNRAINADDDRLHANTWYAILGCTVQLPVLTIGLLGPDWGGQRIGLPAGFQFSNSNGYFADISLKYNLPLIPVFNSNNKGNVLTMVADTTASTSPKVDWNLVELDVPNTQTPQG